MFKQPLRKLSSSSVISSGAMKMPVIGLGTFMGQGEEIEKAVDYALSIGYRHFDTAFIYQNEANIGKVLERLLKSGKLKREDFFITTKLPTTHNAPELVKPTLHQQLESLRLDYVDLYLVHIPWRMEFDYTNFTPKIENGNVITAPVDHVALWRAMEEQVDAGRTRNIGLSNFNSEQILRIVNNARIKPVNLQVEAHIYLQQKDLAKFCSQHGITICAYAPFGSPGSIGIRQSWGDEKTLVTLSPLEEVTVKEIAKTHNKTPAQVLLRFLIQKGFAVIPKSSNLERIKQNFQIFDFDLTNEEMKTLEALDRGPAGRIFNMSFLSGIEKDPNYPFNIPY